MTREHPAGTPAASQPQSQVAENDLPETEKIRPTMVIGPLGELLTRTSLPPSSTSRWTTRRKAKVVAAVNGDMLTVDEACDRYSLTQEEFVSWQRAAGRLFMHGMPRTPVQVFPGIQERSPRRSAVS